MVRDEIRQIAKELDHHDGLIVELNALSGPLCTYRVGGPIDLLVRIESTEGLRVALASLARRQTPTIPIGRGSNMLVSDAGFRGVGLLLGEGFTEVLVEGTVVRAGGAAALPVVARAAVKAGLTGFTWAVGVPGSIGGAVRMNAGGHGSDMAASVESVEVADLRTGELSARNSRSLNLGYRSSSLTDSEVVVGATLQLAPENEVRGHQNLRDIVAWRRENQPGGSNAGSVFTNPPGDSAGRLIDAAGLKGLRVRSAEVSLKHANFIQVDPGGSADDVMELMLQVVTQVEKFAGVRLQAETRLVGFGDAQIQLVSDHAFRAAEGGSDVEKIAGS